MVPRKQELGAYVTCDMYHENEHNVKINDGVVSLVRMKLKVLFLHILTAAKKNVNVKTNRESPDEIDSIKLKLNQSWPSCIESIKYISIYPPISC